MAWNTIGVPPDHGSMDKHTNKDYYLHFWHVHPSRSSSMALRTISTYKITEANMSICAIIRPHL